MNSLTAAESALVLKALLTSEASSRDIPGAIAIGGSSERAAIRSEGCNPKMENARAGSPWRSSLWSHFFGPKISIETVEHSPKCLHDLSAVLYSNCRTKL